MIHERECIINKERVRQLKIIVDILNKTLSERDKTINSLISKINIKDRVMHNLNKDIYELKRQDQQSKSYQLNIKNICNEYVYSNVHNHLNYNDDNEQFKDFPEDYVCKNPRKSIDGILKPAVKIDNDAQYGPYNKIETKLLFESCGCDMDIWTIYLNNHGTKCNKIGASNFVRRNRVCNFDTSDIYEVERLYILIKEYETIENISKNVKASANSIKEYINILKPVNKYLNSPNHLNLKLAEEFYNDLDKLRNKSDDLNFLSKKMNVKKDSIRRALDLMPKIKNNHKTLNDFKGIKYVRNK